MQDMWNGWKTTQTHLDAASDTALNVRDPKLRTALLAQATGAVSSAREGAKKLYQSFSWSQTDQANDSMYPIEGEPYEITQYHFSGAQMAAFADLERTLVAARQLVD